MYIMLRWRSLYAYIWKTAVEKKVSLWCVAIIPTRVDTVLYVVNIVAKLMIS